MKPSAKTVMLITAAALVASSLADHAAAAKASKNAPKDRVVAMYFHRTQRCPTCLKMGTYTETAIKATFAKQLKQGTVEFHYVDFQNKKNAALSKAYKISGPALIVVQVKDNKVKEFKNLKEMWTKVREKPQFVKYVVDNVKAYLTDRAPVRNVAKKPS